MTRKTVLLADIDEEFSVSLRNLLEETGEFSVVLAHDGLDALQKVRNLSPDLLVLDLALPQLDGLSVLHRLRQDGLTLPTLLTSAFVSDRVLREASELGADFFLPKPFDEMAFLEHIRALSIPKIELTPTFLPSSVNLLRAFGMPPEIRGYRYALEAAQLLRAEPELLHALTKAVYPSIAKRHHTTAACVERSLRHAVELAYERGDRAVWARYFGDFRDGKPKNGAFLAVLAAQSREMEG